MLKRISALLLLVAFGVAAFILLDTWRYENLSSINKLQRLWVEDLQSMGESHRLPAGWNSIREIELNPGALQSADWLKKLKVPVSVRTDGEFKLQVLLVPWEEDGKEGVTVQYDLVNLKSSNTVWETNRTFILSDENSWLSKLSDEQLDGTPKDVKK